MCWRHSYHTIQQLQLSYSTGALSLSYSVAIGEGLLSVQHASSLLVPLAPVMKPPVTACPLGDIMCVCCLQWLLQAQQPLVRSLASALRMGL